MHLSYPTTYREQEIGFYLLTPEFLIIINRDFMTPVILIFMFGENIAQWYLKKKI